RRTLARTSPGCERFPLPHRPFHTVRTIPHRKHRFRESLAWSFLSTGDCHGRVLNGHSCSSWLPYSATNCLTYSRFARMVLALPTPNLNGQLLSGFSTRIGLPL